MLCIVLFFFVKQKTAYEMRISDWSSDVCSSDLVARGDEALARAGDDISALRRAHEMAAVARAVDGDDETVVDYLERVDRADTLWELNRDGEHALAGGRYGEDGGGALAKFSEALALEPGQPRAKQGLERKRKRLNSRH